MAYLIILMVAGMVSLTHTKPVMVSFGTNQGPIVPATPRSTTLNPLAPKSAAPVFEREDNAPPPPQYRPPTPHQYRTDIYSARPNPNLILGTPLDIKYTPALDKTHLLNKAKLQKSEGFGVGYTGPQEFEVQVYEIERAAKKVSPAKAFVDQYKKQKRDDQEQTGYQHPQENYQITRRQDQSNQITRRQDQNNQIIRRQDQNYQTYQQPQQQQQGQNYQTYQPQQQQQQASNYQFNYRTYEPQQRRQDTQNYEFTSNSNNYVPQIGIVYSSGVRYYIPQINNDVDNGVYQQNDRNYQYHHQY